MRLRKNLLLLLLLLLLPCTPMRAQKPVQHSVKQGDTMASIAEKYGVTEDALRQANKENADMLFPGLLLNIPSKKEDTNAQETEKTVKYDKVTLRDSTYVICKILNLNANVLSLRQDSIEGTIKIPVKDLAVIEYANGDVKRYNKPAVRKGGVRKK